MTDYWRTIGFTAAAPGWRALYHNEDKPSKPRAIDLIGWKLEERCKLNALGEYIGGSDAPRGTRITPVDFGTDGEVVIVGAVDSFWQILGPSEVMPPEEVCIEACAEYLERRAAEAAERKGTER